MYVEHKTGVTFDDVAGIRRGAESVARVEGRPRDRGASDRGGCAAGVADSAPRVLSDRKSVV